MEVSIWAVLGAGLLLLGLPFGFLLFLDNSTGLAGEGFLAGVLMGGGGAFLVVAVARWVLDRNRALSLDEPDFDSS